MKTIDDLLAALTVEEQAEWAKIDPDFIAEPKIAETLSAVLWGALAWRVTPQGHHYWSAIADRLEAIEHGDDS